MTLQYLHVLVFDLLTGGDAVGDVQVDELRRQIYSCGQPEDQTEIVTGWRHHPLQETLVLWEDPPPAGHEWAESSPVNHLHGVQRHVHVDEHGEVLGDLAAGHQLEQHLYGNQWVVLHQVWELDWCQTDVINQPGVLLQLSQQLHKQACLFSSD